MTSYHFLGQRAKSFGEYFAAKLGCSDSKKRLECLRRKPTKDILEPYFKWFCPFSRRHDPWCNRTAAAPAPTPSDAIAPVATPTPTPTPNKPTTLTTPNKPWPDKLPAIAPVAGFVAVVDGTEEGLPDTPYRMMQQGRINTSPTGGKIQVMLGTMTDEMATFIIALGLVVRGVDVDPVGAGDVTKVMQHLIDYHDGWNYSSVAAAVDKAYPLADYATPLFRMIRIGTHLLFRCGQRRAARTLSSAGIDTYLYSWEFHDNTTYLDPGSKECEKRIGVNCGVYHVRPTPPVSLSSV